MGAGVRCAWSIAAGVKPDWESRTAREGGARLPVSVVGAGRQLCRLTQTHKYAT